MEQTWKNETWFHLNTLPPPQYLATSVVAYTDLSRCSTVYFHVGHVILRARILKLRSLMEFKLTKFLSYIHSLCYSDSNETSTWIHSVVEQSKKPHKWKAKPFLDRWTTNELRTNSISLAAKHTDEILKVQEQTYHATGKLTNHFFISHFHNVHTCSAKVDLVWLQPTSVLTSW